MIVLLLIIVEKLSHYTNIYDEIEFTDDDMKIIDNYLKYDSTQHPSSVGNSPGLK